MEWKFCVIEHQRKAATNIILAPGSPAATAKPVWNILYQVPYEPHDDNDTNDAFNACLVWLEQNKVEGSEYLITEFFFV